MRVLYSTIFLLFSYLQLNIEKNTDWMCRIHGIDNLPIYLKENRSKKFGRHWRQRTSHKIHLDQLNHLVKSNILPPASNDIYHLVIFPVIKEGRDILEPAIEAVSRQHFSLKQFRRKPVLRELTSPTPPNKPRRFSKAIKYLLKT